MAVGGDEDDWSDFEDDQAENPRPEERVKATEEKRSSLKRRTNKRRHDRDDHDFESQQSILKWVRQVPGPLQDVMKKQADQMEGDHRELRSEFASGNSDRYSVAISTVFDEGPWVDMCGFLGMETEPGSLYGGIKMSRLQHTVATILEGDHAPPKIPQLLLLIKSARYVDEELVATFHDPTGEVDGYFHREIVEQIGPALTIGVAILLRNVSVFTPVSSRNRSYLNIVPRNLQRVFTGKVHGPLAPYEGAVHQFNLAREHDVEEVGEQGDPLAPAPTAHLQRQHSVRHTSSEISYLSQRQVVHRNPPVNSTAASIMSGKSTHADNSADNAEQATGLGRWQWNRLLSRPTVAQGNETSNNDEAVAEPVASAIAPKSSTSRSSLGNDDTAGARNDVTPTLLPKKRTPTKVTFAPDVDVSPANAALQSGDGTSGPAASQERAQQPKSATAPPTGTGTGSDSDSDDDDW